jgi:hypothetical protein
MTARRGSMPEHVTHFDFLGSFAKDESVRTIKILGHTGRSIVGVLDQFAAKRTKAGIHGAIQIQILLRDKGAESPRRREFIASAEKNVRSLNHKFEWIKVEIRHYSAIQTLRGTIVVHSDGTKNALFSAYQWVLPSRAPMTSDASRAVRTTAADWHKRLPSGRQDDHRLIDILENWFDYYWGPGIIHTVAFDFDDTIIDTYDDKINAWVVAVDRTLVKYVIKYPGAQYLRHEFK